MLLLPSGLSEKPQHKPTKFVRIIDMLERMSTLPLGSMRRLPGSRLEDVEVEK
jgi:hypothetical protein